ncbi:MULTISPECIES: HIT domain-containing protein [unclassified Sphingomonas]|uniref:HIT domain-containing protein n=1 Tax=unclassified Sphingomonas TaxID=196159 RepID=UPI001607214B|nr:MULTISPECIES: HIT domain-containing protein [unclassified Sphingomonas]MBB3347065.1 diadenosine tetraphosphate (Ap4A) HIT family hydrolase [Sphingomonas sp. BK069]MBB3471901.1 diadenosine tetraphosphate (Ap4A) HIT family hydrolase [Sphingomonas sp. BK345]
MTVDATQPYDDANIFAKLVRGEIPSRRVYEDEHSIVFHDIAPWAPVHLLAVPKGRYVSWDDFSESASAEEIVSLTRAIGQAAREAGLVERGYRLIANTGLDSHAEVPHLHVHILAGRALGPMLAQRDG